MEQIKLFDDEGPQPIQRWLHVWTEAERAERKKRPAPEAQGEGSPKRGEDAMVGTEVMQPSGMNGEEPASPHLRASPRI